MEAIRQELIRLKNLGMDAVVAGGYVRDNILGKNIKDVDYFILNCEERERDIELELSDIESEYDNYGNMNVRDDVLKIIKTKDGDDYICMKDDLHSTLRNFDCSICQACIFVDARDNLQVRVSKDFMDYILSNTIYFYSDIKTSESHIERVRDKFPNAVYKDKESEEVRFIPLTTASKRIMGET